MSSSPTNSNVSVDMSAPERNEADPSMLASKLLSWWSPLEESDPPSGWVKLVRSSRERLTALSLDSIKLLSKRGRES